MRSPSPVPAVSAAEWKLMKLLWLKHPQPAYDIIQQLAETEGWQASTIKTLLARLSRKKAVGIRRYKNLYLYYPLVSEQDSLRVKSETFLERFFDGSAKKLVLHFARGEKLTKADLEELRRLLDKGYQGS